MPTNRVDPLTSAAAKIMMIDRMRPTTGIKPIVAVTTARISAPSMPNNTNNPRLAAPVIAPMMINARKNFIHSTSSLPNSSAISRR